MQKEKCASISTCWTATSCSCRCFSVGFAFRILQLVDLVWRYTAAHTLCWRVHYLRAGHCCNTVEYFSYSVCRWKRRRRRAAGNMLGFRPAAGNLTQHPDDGEEWSVPDPDARNLSKWLCSQRIVCHLKSFTNSLLFQRQICCRGDSPLYLRFTFCL